MPRYWITTQWPRYPGGPEPFDLFLKDKSFAPGLAAGDAVFVYEFATGPAVVLPSGAHSRRDKGRGGVVCRATLTADLQARNPAEAVEQYTNGTTANWRWIARTGARQGGFVDRKVVNSILGYKPTYSYRGFNAGKGIKELQPGEFEQLSAAFAARVRL